MAVTATSGTDLTEDALRTVKVEGIIQRLGRLIRVCLDRAVWKSTSVDLLTKQNRNLDHEQIPKHGSDYGWHNVHVSAESGAALAKLAIAEDVEDVSGRYFEGLTQEKSSEVDYETEKQGDLWNGTVKLVARDEAERRSFEVLS